MTKPESIEWAPYRGELERVTDVKLAKMYFHKDHLELAISYDYIEVSADGAETKAITRLHAILPKNQINANRTVCYHDTDKDQKEPGNIIEIYVTGNSHWIWASEKDIKYVWEVLRKWLLLP